MESFARVFLLAIAAALLLAYLKHGRAGVTAWLKSKFLGHPQATTLNHNGG